MATAYAAFTSLTNLMRDLHEHPNPPIKLDEEHVDSLNSKISFFTRFLEDRHSTVDLRLEIRMADAAHAVEDLIETHIADRVLDQKDFDESLQRVIEGLDLTKKEVMKMDWTEESQGNNQPRRHPMIHASSPSPSTTSGEKIVVGIEETTTKIVDKLTSLHKSDRRIISITGMGGIGKTTLARKVYDNSYIKNYFDIRAWVTISNNYDTLESLLEILHCLGKMERRSFRQTSEHELGEQLYKYLFGRRYLVILDDVWDTEAWNRLRSFFPASNGSGIVITTRESTVASISSHTFRMNLLDESKSWDLFCKNVFGQGSCPRELEDVGKKIAKNCRGLPLPIVVVGGHLIKSPRTLEYWEYIAENLSSIVNSEDNDHCLKILSLSYINLPVHLKPCFLYMGVFPEDQKIRVSRLIKLWVAEGFLKPINGKSHEEAAEDYLNDLICRNLVLTSESSRRGKIRSFTIHDLLRDFCIKEALKTNFLCIVGKQRRDMIEVSNYERRVVVDPSESKVNNHVYRTVVPQSPAFFRTLLFDGILSSIVYKLLRVLSSVSGFVELEQNTWVNVGHNLVNLRCLYFERYTSGSLFEIPPSFVSLWNLQSLALKNIIEVKAPTVIWKMPQLRHLKICELHLPNPPSESNDIMKNLQSAKRIINFSFSEDMVKRLPNIKKLAVIYDKKFEGACSLNNIARLEKLESFYLFSSFVQPEKRNDMLSNITFPHSLKKLRIDWLRWDDVTTKIGSLPLLEVLELFHCSGREWKLVEGQFVRLKFLMLDSCDIPECFTADSSCFPCLQNLELRYIDCLISKDIGDMPTLRSIYLYLCPDSVVASSKEIAEEQHQNGNEELQIKAYVDCVSAFYQSLSTSNFRAVSYGTDR